MSITDTANTFAIAAQPFFAIKDWKWAFGLTFEQDGVPSIEDITATCLQLYVSAVEYILAHRMEQGSVRTSTGRVVCIVFAEDMDRPEFSLNIT